MCQWKNVNLVEYLCSALGIHVPHSNPTTNEIENRILTIVCISLVLQTLT